MATDIGDVVRRVWAGMPRGAFNFHPSYELLSVDRAFEVSPLWKATEQCKLAVGVETTFARKRPDAEVRLVALVGQSPESLRCVQWSRECYVAVNGRKCPYADGEAGTAWSVRLDPGASVDSIHYVDLKHATRVDHDPVAPINALLFIQTAPFLPIPDLVQLLVQDLPRQHWTRHDDGDDDDVLADEFLQIKDPVSMRPIQVPVRPTSCAHPQCFDLRTMLETRYQQHTTTKLSCLHCNCAFDFRALAFDASFDTYRRAILAVAAAETPGSPLARRADRAAQGGLSLPTDLYAAVATPRRAEAEASALMRAFFVEKEGADRGGGGGGGGGGGVAEVDVEDLDDDSSSSSEMVDLLGGPPQALAGCAGAAHSGRVPVAGAEEHRDWRELHAGRVVAFLHPVCGGRTGAPHTVYLAAIESLAPPSHSQPSTDMTVRQLLPAAGEAAHPFFLPSGRPLGTKYTGGVVWQETSGSAVPVEGRWVKLTRDEVRRHGCARGFEMLASEGARLRTLPLDMS